jgi:competence protein ComEA
MLKKFWLPVLALLMFAGSVFAAVDVNNADQAALDSIAGVGPATSKAILAEREKNGNFKDWADLERRVKGVGARNAVKLSAAGLTVNGKAYEGSIAVAKPVEKGVDKGAEKGMEKGTEKGVEKAPAAK